MFGVIHEEGRLILAGAGSLAEIYLFGGVLNRYEIGSADGRRLNVVKAYENIGDCRNSLTQWFRSAKLSPYACRIRNGAYVFSGKKYRCSKHIIQGHAAHGLMYDAEFSLLESGADRQSAWAHIAADYRGADEGYPFAYRITVRYRLDSDGLSLHTCVTNLGADAMPLADGWHPYFTLGGSADDWHLQIRSAQRLDFDGDLVPNGSITADARFLHPCRLQGIGLDNSFVLEQNERAADAPACTLSDGRVSLALYPDNSYPYLQVFIPPQRDCIALENLSGAPDCFNNGLGLRILEPQQTAVFQTRFKAWFE